MRQWQSSSVGAACFFATSTCYWLQGFSYQQLQLLTCSVYFCSRLHVSFSPCDQTFQIPQHISHPVDVLQLHSTYTTVVFWQPLHSVTHFHCFQETFGNLPQLAPFPGTTTAGAVPWLQSASKTPRLQDLEASRQDSCDHYAS